MNDSQTPGEVQRVGVVGLGRMGSAMAQRVADAGFSVIGYDVSASTRAAVAGGTVSVVDDLDAFADVDVLLSSLPDASAVQESYMGSGGLLERLRPGVTCVDHSTIGPSESVVVATSALARGIGFLDAPVSGSPVQVAAGTAALYIGGDSDNADRVDAVLSSFAATRERVGDNGAGLRLKLVANRLFTSHLAAIAESIQELEAMGIDATTGLRLLEQGAVPRLLNYKAPPMAARDWRPGFTVSLMRKDLLLMAEEMPPGPLARLSLDLVEAAYGHDHGGDDIGAIFLELPQRGTGSESRSSDADAESDQ